MEIIIAIAVLGFAVWWFFLRAPADTTTTVYKVETTPTPEPVVEETKPTVGFVQGTITPTPAVTTVVVEEAVAPAKKPRKPRAPKAETPVAPPAAKKAAPVKKAAVKKPAARTAKSKKV